MRLILAYLNFSKLARYLKIPEFGFQVINLIVKTTSFIHKIKMMLMVKKRCSSITRTPMPHPFFLSDPLINFFK